MFRIHTFYRGCYTEYFPSNYVSNYSEKQLQKYLSKIYCFISDAPNKDHSSENNAVPPALNLLPVLNDESVLPGDLPTASDAPESPEKQADPSQAAPITDEEKPLVSDIKEDTNESSKDQTTETSVPVTEGVKLSDPDTEEKVSENETHVQEEPKDASSTDEKEDAGTKALFNSESEIKNNDKSTEATTVTEVPEGDKSTKISDPVEHSVQELREAESQTSTSKIVENEAESVTEKQSEAESTSSGVQPTEKPVKNSAADNSKSLKLSGDEKETSAVESNEVPPKEEKDVSDPQIPEEVVKNDEKVADTPTEAAPSRAETDEPKANKAKASKTGSEENVAEESQSEPQIALFYNQDDKVVKKESAETVTIVVHVREKTKPPTETDFETEKSALESSTDTTQESLLKSSDELQNNEKVEVQDAEVNAATEKNFETFPDSATKVNEDEHATSSPVTDVHAEEKVEARSGETDSTVSTDEKKTTESDSKSDDLPVTTPQNVNDDQSELDKESRANEEIAKETNEDPKPTEIPEEKPKEIEVPVEETKETELLVEEPKSTEVTAAEPKVTEIIIEQPNSNVAIKIEIINNSEEEKPKVEESQTEESKQEETIDESKAEERSEETVTVEKTEETNSEGADEEVKTEEEKKEPQENEEESKPQERSDDKEEKIEVSSENSVEGSKSDDKSKGTTEQVTEVPNQTETPKTSE